MLYQSILKASAILILLPVSVQALPTSVEINQVAQRICNTPRESSESIMSIVMREAGQWLYDKKINIHQLRDEKTLQPIYDSIATKAYDSCPLRFYEINNNYQFNEPNRKS